MTRYFPVTHSILSAEALANEVLSGYEVGAPAQCRLLNLGLNDTYLVQASGAKYILRVYRAGWRSLAAIRYELEVLQHLSAAGVPVSVPLPAKNGQLTNVVAAPEGERYIVLFTYAPGKDPAYNTEEDTEAYLYGKLAAQIHTATDRFHSEHQRFAIDFAYLLDTPLRAIQPMLAHRPQDWDYVKTLAEKLRAHLLAMPLEQLEWGFCHGDFHGWNAHITDGKALTMFDFDCCGMGWRAYDLAVFRWRSRLSEKEQTRWPAFLRGYREHRDLRDIDQEAIPYFVAIRHLWLTGLHLANGHDWGFGWMQDSYFDQSLKFLRDWEAEFLEAGSV